LVIINDASLYPVFEHSYQLSKFFGYCNGGKQLGCPKNEHTHIINVNLIIDKNLENLYKYPISFDIKERGYNK
tara:strand:+ start:821 stop:1039 length:219 start_codon:yes stop_codon:yes gene_type:complete